MNSIRKQLHYLIALGVIAAAFTCEGALSLKFKTAMQVEIDGVVQQFKVNDTFVPPSSPCFYKMRPVLAEGERTYGIKASDNGYCRFPMYGEGNWVRMAIAGSSSVDVTAYKVSNVYYADALHGSNTWDGTTDYEHRDESLLKGPKKTLQAAHDVAAPGSESGGYPIVLVAPGTYNTTVTNVYYHTDTDHAYPCKRRLNVTKGIGFIATAGAERTFIVGARDQSTSNGCGSDAVSGVYFDYNAYGTVFSFMQGFTITGCYHPSTQSKHNQKGAVSTSTSQYAYALDCVISNNVADQYSAACYGTYMRTKFLENEARQFIVLAGNYVSCLFAGNRITVGNGTTQNYALGDGSHNYIFCTIDLRNTREPSGRKRVDHGSAALYGSLIYGLTDKSRTTGEKWHDCVATDEPVFADADNRDYRIGMLSPAIDAASLADIGLLSQRFRSADLDGRMPVENNGKIRVGAVWNEPPLAATRIVGVGGNVSVSGASAGTHVITSANEITVTASQTATRPFVGFEVDGEMVETPGNTYSFTPSIADGSATTVRAIYSNVWYVAQNGGNDANDGGSPTRAKATIGAATALAVSNDVIRVGPGTYGAAESGGKHTSTANSLSRVIIPKFVTVESTEGAEKTFIVGAPSDDAGANAVGNGPGAIRCVNAKNGAVLRGFTLTGGHTEKTASSSTSSYDYYGAAVLVPSDARATIEDCIVSNNYSHYATMWKTDVKRCRIIGNSDNAGTGTDAHYPAGFECSYVECIISGNKGNGTVGAPARVENCTFGTGNLMHTGSSPQLLHKGSPHRRVINSLFLDSNVRWYGTVYATNCIFAVGQSSGGTLDAANCGNCLFGQSAAKLNVTDYKPNPGSVAIDFGDNALASFDIDSAKDILGTPRVLNGAIDVGAIEYDWRPKFAQEVGKRITIEYASPSVSTNAAGGLLMPSGEISGKVAIGGKYSFTFDIVSGTIEAFVGGVSAGTLTSAGEQTITVNIPDAETEFRLVFTPDAETPVSAVLKKIASNRGFILTCW